jgi:hypothetical protein
MPMLGRHHMDKSAGKRNHQGESSRSCGTAHPPDDAQNARSPIVHAAQARYWSITVCTFVRLGCTSSMRAGMWRSKKKQPPRRDRLTWHMRTSLLSSIYCIYCMHVCAECGILPWYSMHIEWADAHPSCTQAILAVSETPTSYRQ